jgi:hypothetical protein
MPKLTNAANMARIVGVDPNAFRNALRNANYPRKRGTDWEVTLGDPAYSGMRTVLVSLLRRRAA